MAEINVALGHKVHGKQENLLHLRLEKSENGGVAVEHVTDSQFLGGHKRYVFGRHEHKELVDHLAKHLGLHHHGEGHEREGHKKHHEKHEEHEGKEEHEGHSKGERKGSEGHGGYLVSEGGKGHLPVEKNGKVDHRLMGAAWAALHEGYRGHKYEGPDKSGAIAKLRRLYKAHGLKPPGE